MDSISQVVLGASVCVLASGQSRRRMLAYGAALATLPDLDVLVLGHLDPVEQFIRHRSFSHSLFVLSALSVPLAWLLRRLDRQLQTVAMKRWLLAVWLTLVTHPLLDAFTVYGTQLWWPLTPHPTSWASIFIIDPLYTLPLLVAVVYCLMRPRGAAVRRAMVVALLCSHFYLLWGLVAQRHVERQVRESMALAQIEVADVLASPAPFTSMLWRVLLRTPEGHSEGWVSLLRNRETPVHFTPIAQNRELRGSLPDLPALQSLEWFSHGYLLIEDVEGRLRVSDLRMGAEPDYFFRFDIARRSELGWEPVRSERVEAARPRSERLGEIFDRL